MSKIERTSVTVRGHLDTRVELKKHEGKKSYYSVKLALNWNKKRRYRQIPVESCTKDDWKNIKKGAPKTDFQKEVHESLQVILVEATKVVKELGDKFTFERFDEEFFKDRSRDRNDVWGAFGDYINNLRGNRQLKTATGYECAMSSLKKFKPTLTFDEVTPKYLQQYEDWMKEQDGVGEKKISDSTIGMYLRNLRTIMNKAKSKGVISEEQYPFGRSTHGKYVIPSSENTKKALTRDEVTAIKGFATMEGTKVDTAKDYWLFSYYINGMNLTDIAYLKWEDIDEEAGMIRYKRHKTARTNKAKAKLINAVITEGAREIIGKLGTTRHDKSDYMFPILKGRKSLEAEAAAIKQTVKKVNIGLKSIAKELGIQKRITFYSARHTHSTMLLLYGGATIEEIQDNLGHSSIKTTQNYLASFDDDSKKEKSKVL